MDAYFTRMIGIFGSVDALAEDFIGKKTVDKILAMPSGPGKDAAKVGAGAILPEMKKRVESEQLKIRIQNEINKLSGSVAAAAAGRRKTRRFKKKRLMSEAYCKKTPCKRMGFTQKASCRPYKNCYQ
jgi:hypothetical protein